MVRRSLPEAAPSYWKEMQRAEGPFVTGGAQLPKIMCVRTAGKKSTERTSIYT